MKRLEMFFVTAFGFGLSVFAGSIDYSKELPKGVAETLDLGFPVICIETIDGEMPVCEEAEHPEGAMGNGIKDATKVPGSVERYEPDGTLSFSSGPYEKKVSGMTVKIRGNSSARAERKPYKIKLQKKGDLLNRGDKNYADKNWAIINDRSMRNWYGHALARQVRSGWQPDCEYVNVVFNGENFGLYLLIETIERNEKCRIDTEESGFVAERDPYWWNEIDGYLDSPLLPSYGWTMKYPELAETDEETRDFIRESLNGMLEACKKGDGAEWLDVESAAEFLFVHDLLNNRDGGGANLYFIRNDGEPGTKLKVGPNWDFDWLLTGETGWSSPHNTEPFGWMWRDVGKELEKTYRKVYEDKIEGVDAYVRELWASGLDNSEAFDRSAGVTNEKWTSNTWDTWDEAREGMYEDFCVRRDWIGGQVEGMSGIPGMEVPGMEIRGGTVIAEGLIRIYSVDGFCVASGEGTVELPGRGIWIVKGGGEVRRVLKF